MCFVAIAATLPAACMGTGPVTIVDVQMDGAGGIPRLLVETDSPVVRAQVFSAEGALIAEQRIAGLRRFSLMLPPGTGIGSSVQLRVVDVGGASAESTVSGTTLSASALTIRSPFDAGETNNPITMVAGSSATVMIEFDGTAIPPGAELHVEVSPPVLVSSAEAAPSHQIVFTLENSGFRHWVLSLGAPDGPEVDATITARIIAVENNLPAYTVSRVVRIYQPARLAAALHISALTMPVDEHGGALPAVRQNLLFIENDSRQFGSGDGITSVMRPLGWQSVEIANTLPVAVPVIVSAAILDGDGAGIAEAFATPPGIPGQRVRGGATVPAGGTATVILPLFGEPERIAPGSYQREVSLTLAGNDHILERRRAALEVERGGGLPLTVTIACALITIAASLCMVFGGPGLLAGFNTRQIILIGLFAAVSVVIVTAPAWVVTSMTMMLLGPMGFVVDGLFSVLLFFSLLSVLLSLVPKPGVCAALVGTRFLLGGLLLGTVTPVGAMHAGITAVALEGALWLRRRLPRDPARAGDGMLDLTGILLLAAANTIVSWAGFQLSIVVFRMFYADWYLWLSVVLGGFVYAVLGAWLGRKIGRSLTPAVT